MRQRSKLLLTVQSVLWGVTATVLIASAVSIYVSGLSLRSADPTAEIYTVEAIGQRAVFALPLLALSVATSIVLGALGVRDERADKPAGDVDFQGNFPEHDAGGERLGRIRAIVLSVAAVFVVVGIFNGSMADVLIKATRICTECVGLG
jgi:hypothetical protein